ncbi:MAG: hypothetical protein JXQ30_11250 [Spirochaetes bacterium]|nr:hypothetical protein [Spirochaetota bacterium]
MKKYIAIVISALLVCASVFIFSGCPSDSTPGTPPTVEGTREVIQGTHVGYPPSSYEKEYSTFMTVSFIDTFIMFANLYLDMPGWQGSDGTYTYSYAGDGDDFTLTLAIVWNGQKGMWHYTLTLDGTIDTVTYSNVTIFDLYATPNADSGEVVFRNPDNQDEYLSLTWEKGDPYYTFIMTAYFDSEPFTTTLVETPPYLVGEVWTSDSGRLRIVSGEETFNAFWGDNPPPEF